MVKLYSAEARNNEEIGRLVCSSYQFLAQNYIEIASNEERKFGWLESEAWGKAYDCYAQALDIIQNDVGVKLGWSIALDRHAQMIAGYGNWNEAREKWGEAHSRLLDIDGTERHQLRAIFYGHEAASIFKFESDAADKCWRAAAVEIKLLNTRFGLDVWASHLREELQCGLKYASKLGDEFHSEIEELKLLLKNTPSGVAFYSLACIFAILNNVGEMHNYLRLAHMNNGLFGRWWETWEFSHFHETKEF